MQQQIIWIIFILLGIGVYLYLKKVAMPKLKGSFGEIKVSLRLKLLSKKKHIVLNDVLLRVGESTTQIDHIVISKSGLFVIETKNYKGWIHGHENSDYWKQTIFTHKYSFENPIKQNKVHVSALKRILSGYPQIRYFPLVVFSGGAVLKNVTHWSPVIYSNQLIAMVREQDSESNLTFDQMKRISDQLNKVRIRGWLESSKHVKRIKKKVRENREHLTSESCPKCGSYLVKRNGKSGEFLGCANFPRCRYTEKMVRSSSNRS
jgi:hypothetical protein